MKHSPQGKLAPRAIRTRRGPAIAFSARGFSE
jgi:hypothetical protein